MAKEPLGKVQPDVQSDAPVQRDHGSKDDRIRERAYQIWEDEGHPHGRELEHWSRARREIEGERTP